MRHTLFLFGLGLGRGLGREVDFRCFIENLGWLLYLSCDDVIRYTCFVRLDVVDASHEEEEGKNIGDQNSEDSSP